MHTEKVRKAQGMPLNIVIIAVILLIVLVLVVAVFRTNFLKAADDLQSCAIKGGEWLKESECSQKNGRVYEGIKYKNPDGTIDENKKCCIVLFKEEVKK